MSGVGAGLSSSSTRYSVPFISGLSNVSCAARADGGLGDLVGWLEVSQAPSSPFGLAEVRMTKPIEFLAIRAEKFLTEGLKVNETLMEPETGP